MSRVQVLRIHDGAHELGIHEPVACIIDGIEADAAPSAILGKAIAETVAQVQAGTPLALAEAAGFDELFARLGYADQTPAGARLVASIGKKGFPRYNHIVDACNVMSARYASGIGLHDASSLDGDIEVKRASGEERIVPLFKSEAVKVRRGDLVYHCGGRLLAWLGRRDVDSHEHRIVTETESLLCIVLGNQRTSSSFNRSIAEGLVDLIRTTCPQASVRFLATERNARQAA